MPRYANESELLPRPVRYAQPDDFEQDQPEYGWLDRAVSTGLRVVPALGGAAAGTLAGLAGTGGAAAPYLGLAGGAAGGGFGEWLAQKYEQARGLRKDTNLGSVAVETALGAIPLGKSATLLRAGAKGAGMGIAGAVGHGYAEQGEMPDAQTLGLSALFGGAFGAGGEALSNRLTRGRPAATGAEPDVEFVPDPDIPAPSRPHRTWHGPEAPRPGNLRYVETDAGLVSERVPPLSRAPRATLPRPRRLGRYEGLPKNLTDEEIDALVEQSPVLLPSSENREEYFRRDASIQRGGEPFEDVADAGGPDLASVQSEIERQISQAAEQARLESPAGRERFAALDRWLTEQRQRRELDELSGELVPGDLPSTPSLREQLIQQEDDVFNASTENRARFVDYLDERALQNVADELAPGDMAPSRRTLLEDLLLQDERRTVRELYEDNLRAIEEQGLARKPRGGGGQGTPPVAVPNVPTPSAPSAPVEPLDPAEWFNVASTTSKQQSWTRTMAEDAVASGFPGSVDDAEQEIVRRTRQPYDELQTYREDVGPNILDRVRQAGGLSLDDKYLRGEVRWLSEFRDPNAGRSKAGTLGGVKDVLRGKGKGKSADYLAELLLGGDATGGDLVEEMAAAARRGGGGRQAERAANRFHPEDYAEAVGIRPGARWWDDAPPFVHELTPELIDEPGAAGFIRAELASTVGGGLAGGAAGATQGDTPEERFRNALLGAAAGAGGGYGLTRLLRGRVPGESIPGGAPQGASPSAQILRASGLAEHAAPPTFEKPRQMETSAGRVRFDEKTGDTPIVSLPRAQEPYPPRVQQPKAQREDLGLEHFPEEQRDTLQELVNTYGLDALEEQRRGRQPNALTDALSRELTAHGGKKLTPGTNLPAEGHRHFVNTLASVHQRVRELGQRISETGGTDAEQMELGKLVSAQEVLFFSYAGLRTEAGRALQQYRMLANVLPTELRVVRDLLNRGRIRKDLAELSDMLANLGDDPDGVKTFLLFRNKQTRSLSDRIGSYFSANILSGLQTQERNFLGGAARTFGRLASKPVIGGLDALESLITGRARQVYSTEALHEAQGVIAGFDRAVRDAYQTLKLGFSPEGIKAGLADVDRLYYPKAEFGGGGKNPLNWVGRGMEAADRFWRSLNASMELHALTYADARRAAEHEGLAGAAYDSFVARQITENRANPSKALLRRVNATAERAVYQEDNALANQLNALKKHAPALHYVLPFVKTVANIFKQGIEHTPFGFLMARAKSGNARERAIAQGEAAMGTLAMIPIAYYAATGRMSGSGPRDPAERARLYESGWRPHSVKMALPAALAQSIGASVADDGEYWVSYALAQPFSIPAAIIANGFEAFDEISRNASEKTREQAASDIATQTLARVGKSALDQSFLSGLGSFVEAINDPERAAEGFFGRTAQGFVPMSGALRNVARVLDPVVRRPEGLLESFQSNLPGLSERVPPRLTRFGEPVVREDSSALVVPEVSPIQRDAISDELARLGVTVALPTDRMSGVGRQLTRDESFQVRQTRGRTVRALLSAVMGAPGYENLPDVVKSELLQRALEQVKGDVNELLRAAVMLQRPDLLEHVSAPIAEAAQRTY